jgi:hypothetical protein
MKIYSINKCIVSLIGLFLAGVNVTSCEDKNIELTGIQLYDGFYARGLYRDLWFEWKGKPLVLCPDENLPEECRNFFTLRDSWFDSRGGYLPACGAFRSLYQR